MNEKRSRVCPCGAPITRRATACRSCHTKRRNASRTEAANPRWKGPTASAHSKRDRARRRVALGGVCLIDGCDAPAYDRHHLDGDLDNYGPSNIALLCRRHHFDQHVPTKPRDERGRFVGGAR